MSDRDLALARQRTYGLMVSTTEAWAAETGRSKWGPMYRLVLAGVAGAAGITFADNTGAVQDTWAGACRSFLDRVTTDGSLVGDVRELDPLTPVTADHEARARDIVDHWDKEHFFLADLAAQPGVPGPKGDPGPPGPVGGGAYTLPGALIFDNIKGDDDAKVRAINEHFRNGQRGVVLLPLRGIRTTEQLELWSATKIVGTLGCPAREYQDGTTWTYEGPESSIFRWVDNKGRHSYPNDGSPRSGTVKGIEFRGARDLIPRTASHPGRTLWYWLFTDIGLNGLRSGWIGYGNGTQFMMGVSHAQACTGTIVDLGGSENSVFSDEHSFVDTKAAPGGTVFFRFKTDKCYVGKVMITTRGTYIAMEIYGGHSLHVKGVSFDAQDSDASAECAVRITGGDGIHLTDGKFKGMAKTGVRPVIDVLGGRQIVIDNNDFIRKGADGQIGPVNTALVRVGSAVADRQVKVGTDNALIGGYTGRLVAARATQFRCYDLDLKVEVG